MHNNEWLAQNKYLGASKYYYYYCCILLVSSLLLLLLIIIYFPKISLYFSYVQRKWPRGKWGVREVMSLSAFRLSDRSSELTFVLPFPMRRKNTLICSSSSASLGSQETSTFGWSCSPSERVTTCPRLYTQWNWEILALNPKCDTLLTPEFMYFRWTRASELEGGAQEQRSPFPPWIVVAGDVWPWLWGPPSPWLRLLKGGTVRHRGQGSPDPPCRGQHVGLCLLMTVLLMSRWFCSPCHLSPRPPVPVSR